MLRYINGVEFL